MNIPGVGLVTDRVTAATEGSAALITRAANAVAVPSSKAVAATRALNPIRTQPTAAPVDGVDAANLLLKQLGITTFTPTIGLSTDLSLPFAVGGAVAGPYTPGIGNLSVANVNLNAVRVGEILVGFLPVGVFTDFGDKSGVQVAWLNLSTLRGGLGAPLSGLTDAVLDAFVKRARSAPIPQSVYTGTVNRLKKALNIVPSNGVRGGLVDTGPGLVLCAVYGTVRKGGTTYAFLPSIGLTRAL